MGSRVQPRALIATAMLALAVLAALVALVALVACGSSGASAAKTDVRTGSDLPCAVADVLTRRCQTCHGATTQYGAPMPLVTRADLVAASPGDPGRRVFEEVAVRIHDDARPMPKAPNERLDAADTKLLDDWIAAGAPASATSDACAPSSGAPDAGVHLSCAPDVQVRPAAPYALSADTADILICYGWESPHPSKRHIIGLSPAIVATRQLHHVTLLESDEAVSPVPGPCSPAAMTTWRSLYGWAPGASGLELPPQAGLPEGPGTHLVVQMHFVNPSHEAVQDTSGFDLCTTDHLRPNDADVMAFGTTEITIPARGSRAVDCSIPVPADGATTHLFAAFPHMHKLGKSIVTTVRAGGTGAPVDLGSVPNWDYANQTWLPVDYTLRPGDVVQSKCSWNNPSDHGVGYGPTSDDEMCFSYVMYFPKIAASTWNWSLPALYSTCH
jgi:mono/diheme cytochrome c family protein